MTDFHPPLGEPPSIEWVEAEFLKVDPAYQRVVEGSVSKRLIQKIAENWDWRLCGPLTVSNRCPDNDAEWSDEVHGFFVIDGQHRLAAATMRGDIPALPCMVSQFGSQEAEAMLFVSLNSARRQVTALDRFHAKVACKDPMALEIKSLVEEAGMKVARSDDHVLWGPLEVAFPDAIGHAIRTKKNGASLFGLTVLAKAYPEAKLRKGRELFDGLTTMFHRDRSLDPNEVATCLATKRQLEWVMARDKLRALEEIMFTNDAMANVIIRALRPGSMPTPIMPAAPSRAAAAHRGMQSGELDEPSGIWCDQCDKMVTREKATTCASRFCKAAWNVRGRTSATAV